MERKTKKAADGFPSIVGEVDVVDKLSFPIALWDNLQKAAESEEDTFPISRESYIEAFKKTYEQEETAKKRSMLPAVYDKQGELVENPHWFDFPKIKEDICRMLVYGIGTADICREMRKKYGFDLRMPTVSKIKNTVWAKRIMKKIKKDKVGPHIRSVPIAHPAAQLKWLEASMDRIDDSNSITDRDKEALRSNIMDKIIKVSEKYASHFDENTDDSPNKWFKTAFILKTAIKMIRNNRVYKTPLGQELVGMIISTAAYFDKKEGVLTGVIKNAKFEEVDDDDFSSFDAPVDPSPNDNKS